LVEQVQMLHDGRQRDRERFRQVADRSAFLVLEARKNCPPRRINEHRKGAIELIMSIVHHMVKYLVCAERCQVRIGPNWKTSGCPLWVKSRHSRRKKSCPLYPRKRTCAVQLGMSAMGQKRTLPPL